MISHNQARNAFASIFLTVFFCAHVCAQMTVTGMIGGTVMDASGTVVPNAKITLISESTKQIREASSGDSGSFNLVAVLPDTYTIRVEHAGFRVFERTGIVVTAIGEVKIVLNSYRAEYAGNGGTVVMIVSKSGGTEFHGNGYYYGRNEALNANDFFNNRNGGKRPEYNTMGFTFGGPIYIPGKFNTSKTNLFGFYNFEQLIDRIPGTLTNYMTPTALERQGNFSQTVDTSGKLIPVNDPLNNHIAFPGNVIPANRLDPNGLALLKILPQPNFINPAITGNTYNDQIREVQVQPKRSQLFKIDYVPTDRDRFWVRGKTWLSTQQGYAVAAGAKPTGFFGQCYCFSEEGIATGWTHIFSPAMVNELTAGVRRNHEGWKPDGNSLSTVLRSAVGFTAGQWYPSSNPDGIIPRVTFGISNSPDISFDDRFLKNGTDFTFSFNDNLTWTRGAHTIKARMDVYRIREYEGERSLFDGTYTFSKDTNNPLDTNWAFANAALGVFDSYTESNARYGANERQAIVEWFAQDTWKVTRRLTLDYGARFTWANQMYPHFDGQQSVLALGLYNPAQAPVFYQPTLGPGNVRMAQNPLTGALLPQAYVGFFVPNNPRFSVWSPTTENPPAILSPIAYYGTISTLLRTSGVLGPSNTNAFQVNAKTPRNYNASFDIQQDLGHSLLLDVSYATVLGRDLQQNYNINLVPYGSEFLPQNTDPTTKKPLPDNFFRPYPGYANITYYANTFTSNYHALLVSLNRRFAHPLRFGVSYAYSKYMDQSTTTCPSGAVGSCSLPLYQNLRTYSYGVDPADQTHNATFNFSYDLPAASKLLPNPVVRVVFDHWSLSGIGQFATGQPVALSFSTTDIHDTVANKRILNIQPPRRRVILVLTQHEKVAQPVSSLLKNPGRIDSAAIPVSIAKRPPSFKARATAEKKVRAPAASKYPKLFPKQYAPSNSEAQGRSHISPATHSIGSGLEPRASTRNSSLRSTPIIRCPRPASSTACRPLPHGTSRNRAFAPRATTRSRKSASARVCSALTARRHERN